MGPLRLTRGRSVATRALGENTAARRRSGADGLFDVEFGLWDAASGGSPIGVPQVLENIPVTDGLFTV